jgi:GGDEF domain-containing protein
MCPEEMQRELLTSEVTGLPNRRAFNEAGAAGAVAMSDVDGLKALNQFGYEVGNAVLMAKADALREVGLDAYHDKGDEFLCRGHSIEELLVKLERARAILRDRTIVVERSDGSSLSITGADFSYGVGKNIHEAEFRLQRHKAERKKRGEIARGELRGITIRESNRKNHRQAVEAKSKPENLKPEPKPTPTPRKSNGHGQDGTPYPEEFNDWSNLKRLHWLEAPGWHQGSMADMASQKTHGTVVKQAKPTPTATPFAPSPHSESPQRFLHVCHRRSRPRSVQDAAAQNHAGTRGAMRMSRWN